MTLEEIRAVTDPERLRAALGPAAAGADDALLAQAVATAEHVVRAHAWPFGNISFPGVVVDLAAAEVLRRVPYDAHRQAMAEQFGRSAHEALRRLSFEAADWARHAEVHGVPSVPIDAREGARLQRIAELRARLKAAFAEPYPRLP